MFSSVLNMLLSIYHEFDVFEHLISEENILYKHNVKYNEFSN